MYALNRILVCLDLTDMDEQLIKASAVMANLHHSKNFFFLHVVETLELPKNIQEKYPDLIAPVDENVRKIIEENIQEHFETPDNCSYEIGVVEGNRTDIVLKWSKDKEVDLIMMGKKVKDFGSGILPEKIVKVCHCSFMLVPFNSYHELKRIMVPVDFSKNSKMALEHAIELSKTSGAVIICQHCYKVPAGYHTSGKSYAEFAEIMRANSVHDFAHFMQDMGLEKDTYRCIHTLVESRDAAHAIHETAVNENMDIIVMASKGRTGLASILLGSVAMRTVKYDLEVELLVVKDKKENMGFLEALLNV